MMVDTVMRFWTVCMSETYDGVHKLADITKWKISSLKSYFKQKSTKQELKKKMKHANSYAEWKKYAEQYDSLKDIQIWRETQETGHYDWQYIKNLTSLLHEARINDDFKKVILLVRSNAVRNLANILNPALYSKSYIGTKHIVEDFQKEVFQNNLSDIGRCNLDESKMSGHKKFDFFSETRHAYGRTALIFSGGANMGLYHYGVTRCLFEENLLPRIVAGSSIGSILASFLCTKSIEDVKMFLNPDNINLQAFHKRDNKLSLLRKIKRFISQGVLMDKEVIKEFMRDNIGDITFQEAHKKTGWILNITVTGYGRHDGSRLLNYLTAPNVLIWSAVCASCAIPYVYGATELYCKNEDGLIELYVPGNRKFVDGSIGADLPMKNLSEFFNVNYFVVSQTNPWVVPFMNHSESYRHSKRRIAYRVWEVLKDAIGSELKHRINQLDKLGLFPSAIARSFNLITQQYGGHVTIWPRPTLKDFLHLMDPPTYEMLRWCLIKGASRAYPRVSQIYSVLMIEKALERNYQKLRKHMEKKSIALAPQAQSEEEDSDETLSNSILYDEIEFNSRKSIVLEKTQSVQLGSVKSRKMGRIRSSGNVGYLEEKPLPIDI